MASFARRPALSLPSVGLLRSLAVVLVLTYAALAGETIHCQYFATSHTEHAGHSTQSKRTTGHAAHCLVASHATSAAVIADSGTLIQAPPPLARLVALETFTAVSALSRLTPARAPPLA